MCIYIHIICTIYTYIYTYTYTYIYTYIYIYVTYIYIYTIQIYTYIYLINVCLFEAHQFTRAVQMRSLKLDVPMGPCRTEDGS